MATIRSFEELNCWKVAADLRKDISAITKTFPPSEKLELCSQMRRAARSVTNNIAEGFGRYHYQEFIRFCRIGRASLFELKDHLLIAEEEHYISNVQLLTLTDKIEKCVALINGLIKYLKSRKEDSGSKLEEPIYPYILSNHPVVVNNERING
jgi:four helix bundle protein